MADIRKGTFKTGTSYQVRYPRKSTKSGYAFKAFKTLKEARAFRDRQAGQLDTGPIDPSVRTVNQAIDKWLDICLKEGQDGRDPVTS